MIGSKMSPLPTAEKPAILFGVTSSQSLKLLGKIPSALAEKGWDVHVVAGDTASRVPQTLTAIELHTLPMVRNPSPLKDSYSLVNWILLLRKIKPVIVVIGTPKAALLGMIASFFCRVPIRVYQVRGLRLQTVSGPARHVLFFLEWVTAKSATSILSASNSLKEEYCSLGLSGINKIEVLGLGSSAGVDVHYFHPTNWSAWDPPETELRQARSEGTPVLGFVGRFSKDKGAQELLQCCTMLLESGIPHTLLIIGPVEGAKDTLHELSQLNQKVVIIGSVEDVAPYYMLMDLLILPTHREGFPNAVLEAAASGIPAVTTNATGAIDSVINGKTGVIVPAHDGIALAIAVTRLLKDPERLEELGNNAREWVVSHFSSDLVTQKFFHYLLQRLQAKNPPK